MAAPLKIYIKPWCPWCVRALKYLDEHGYRYEAIDVLKDADAYQEMRDLSGQSLTPTLVVDSKVLPDFGPDELAVFLEKYSITP